MATYTDTYNLILPEAEDSYDAEDYNENFRAIDSAFSSIEDSLADIDTALDSMSQKIDALAGKSSAALKSVQTVDVTHDTRQALDQSYSINTVDPSRCFVIMTNLCDTQNSTQINYYLNASSLRVTLTAASYSTMYLRFQIIEFY